VAHPHMFLLLAMMAAVLTIPSMKPVARMVARLLPRQYLCLVILMIVPMTAAAQYPSLVLAHTYPEGDPDLRLLVCLLEAVMTMIVQGSNLINWASLAVLWDQMCSLIGMSRDYMPPARSDYRGRSPPPFNGGASRPGDYPPPGYRWVLRSMRLAS
jgi:hypothetical protein